VIDYIAKCLHVVSDREHDSANQIKNCHEPHLLTGVGQTALLSVALRIRAGSSLLHFAGISRNCPYPKDIIPQVSTFCKQFHKKMAGGFPLSRE
jgi:hypothetical protein